MTVNEASKLRGPCRRGDPDAEAVAKALAGDESGLEELKSKYFAVLKNMAFEDLGNATAAREVAEEALEDAFLNLSGFRGEANFRTWLNKVTKSRIEKKGRQLARQRNVVSLDDTPPDPGDDEDNPVAELAVAPRASEPEEAHRLRRLRVDLARLIHRLTPALQEIFYMLLANLETDEIAEVLDTNDGIVRMYVKRGRAKLKEMREKGKSD